jgi:hypothetical protein
VEGGVLGEIGVDGADVKVSAAGGDPVVDLVDLDLEAALEVLQGHFGLAGPSFLGGYFL